MAETPVKTVAIGDMLSESQVKRAITLYEQHFPKDGSFVEVLVREIIEPGLDEINRKLGQENNPHYLAYMVHHALNCAARGEP